MLKKKRLDQIIDILQSKGVVEVSMLCRIFGVTEMTIRRDLDELAKKKLIIRTHGGGVLPEENILIEKPYEIRLQKNIDEKDAIAKKALKYIKDGQKIILDSGSTIFSLAKLLGNVNKIMVITNANNIAAELNMRTNISVISVGGELRKNSYSCAGVFAEEMLKKIKADLGFVAVNGIDENGEIYCGSIVEVGVKRAMIKSAARKFILVDSSKIGKSDFVSFGNLRAIDYLITDSKAPSDLIKEYEKTGVKIILAEVKNRES
jgi:DeoR/GlpR family transcriptional regulator of sugar metabolism